MTQINQLNPSIEQTYREKRLDKIIKWISGNLDQNEAEKYDKTTELGVS